MKKIAIVCFLTLGFASTASATSISYTVNTGAGTLNGNNVTNVAILEAGGGQTSLQFGFTVNGSGLTTLTHDVDFVPTSTLIVGLDLPGSIGDGKTHVVFFASDAFAQSVSGGTLFSVAFPHTRHNDFITRLLAAEGGDASQQAWLLDFFAGDGAAAAFASNGPSVAVEFSPATVLTPEPGTLVLLGLGLAGAGVAARRRR